MKKRMTGAFLAVFCLAMLFCGCSGKEAFIEYPGQGQTRPENESNRIQNYTYSPVEDGVYPYNAISGPEQLKYDNGVLYFFNGNPSPHEKSGATLMAFDLARGTILPVCPDPLCSHDNPSCPFYGFDTSYYAVNGSIYYRRGYHYLVYNAEGILVDTIDHADLVRYDRSKEALTVYEDYDGEWTYTAYSSQLYFDNWQYYYDYVYDPDTEKHYFHICKRDVDSGRVAVLGGDLNEDAVYERFLFAYGSRIYATDGKQFFSVDSDWNDRRVLFEGDFSGKILFDGSEVFFERMISDRKILEKTRLDDGEVTNLGVECSRWVLTDHYIYYLSADPFFSGGLELTGGEVYRCDHNGDHVEKVCTLNDDGSDKYLGSMCVVDNYIYCFFYEYKDGEQISYRDRLLRIDATTGVKMYYNIK
ncbi:MAG: hypothetical protein IKQ92_05685 [Clostridia bacterium]|nr:hypothetical protein [Clostridia bacterium]